MDVQRNYSYVTVAWIEMDAIFFKKILLLDKQ